MACSELVQRGLQIGHRLIGHGAMALRKEAAHG